MLRFFIFSIFYYYIFFLKTIVTAVIVVPDCKSITDTRNCSGTQGCTNQVCNGTYNPFPTTCNAYNNADDCQNAGCNWGGCTGSGLNYTCSNMFTDQNRCTQATGCTWNINKCTGNYTPTTCSNLPNQDICLTAINCIWKNNRCMQCSIGNNTCDPLGPFTGYKDCNNIDEAQCLGTNGCSPKCTSKPNINCGAISNELSCSVLPGCFWRKNSCFGALIKSTINCSNLPLSNCENNPGCTLTSVQSINQGISCMMSSCYDIINKDLCNSIVGCIWDRGFCYVGSERLSMALWIILLVFLIYH